MLASADCGAVVCDWYFLFSSPRTSSVDEFSNVVSDEGVLATLWGGLGLFGRDLQRRYKRFTFDSFHNKIYKLWRKIIWR